MKTKRMQTTRRQRFPRTNKQFNFTCQTCGLSMQSNDSNLIEESATEHAMETKHTVDYYSGKDLSLDEIN
jgi:hypothetical protein